MPHTMSVVGLFSDDVKWRKMGSGLWAKCGAADDNDGDGMWRTTTRMQRARQRVEHWPARKHVCVCADSERFSAIAPEPPMSPPPMRTNPLAAATRATAHPHWSVALRPATVAERIPRNRRPPPSKPTRPYVDNILIVIVSVI